MSASAKLVVMKDEDVVLAPAPLYLVLSGELESSAWMRVLWPEGPPYGVCMRLGRTPDGRVACSGLILGGSRRFGDPVFGITAASLRSIPIGQLVDVLTHRTSGPGYGLLEQLPGFQRPTRLGPKGIPRERLAEVAALYRQALEERPSAPVRWISEHILGPTGKTTPVSTVRRWLQRCRDLELLGPSIPGKAGEGPRPGAKREERDA